LAIQDQRERRVQPRMRYGWEMYFEQPGLAGCRHGQMVDLSQTAARFAVAGGAGMEPGVRLDLRLSHPYVTDQYGYEVRTVSRAGQVLRVDQDNGHGQHVTVMLDRPLHYGMDGQDLPG
jgi:hypothetical protein